MYLVNFGVVKLIVTLATECRFNLINFVDDVHGFFTPVKKDPGRFPDFFNFVDKIHEYFVPVKETPDLLPTITSYFCGEHKFQLIFVFNQTMVRILLLSILDYTDLIHLHLCSDPVNQLVQHNINICF